MAFFLRNMAKVEARAAFRNEWATKLLWHNLKYWSWTTGERGGGGRERMMMMMPRPPTSWLMWILSGIWNPDTYRFNSHYHDLADIIDNAATLILASAERECVVFVTNYCAKQGTTVLTPSNRISRVVKISCRNQTTYAWTKPPSSYGILLKERGEGGSTGLIPQRMGDTTLVHIVCGPSLLPLHRVLPAVRGLPTTLPHPIWQLEPIHVLRGDHGL